MAFGVPYFDREKLFLLLAFLLMTRRFAVAVPCPLASPQPQFDSPGAFVLLICFLRTEGRLIGKWTNGWVDNLIESTATAVSSPLGTAENHDNLFSQGAWISIYKLIIRIVNLFS